MPAGRFRCGSGRAGSSIGEELGVQAERMGDEAWTIHDRRSGTAGAAIVVFWARYFSAPAASGAGSSDRKRFNTLPISRDTLLS